MSVRWYFNPSKTCLWRYADYEEPMYYIVELSSYNEKTSGLAADEENLKSHILTTEEKAKAFLKENGFVIQEGWFSDEVDYGKLIPFGV